MEQQEFSLLREANQALVIEKMREALEESKKYIEALYREGNWGVNQDWAFTLKGMATEDCDDRALDLMKILDMEA